MDMDNNKQQRQVLLKEQMNRFLSSLFWTRPVKQYGVILPACGESGVPYLREGVPEDKGGVSPCLGHLYLPLTCHVRLVEGNLTVGIRYVETNCG